MRDVDHVVGAWVRAGGVWEISIHSPQFCCDPKIALRKVLFLKKKFFLILSSIFFFFFFFGGCPRRPKAKWVENVSFQNKMLHSSPRTYKWGGQTRVSQPPAHTYLRDILLKMRRVNYQIPGGWENHKQPAEELHSLCHGRSDGCSLRSLQMCPMREEDLSWHERLNSLWSSVHSLGFRLFDQMEKTQFKSVNGGLVISFINTIFSL